jgi:hypothetical protein
MTWKTVYESTDQTIEQRVVTKSEQLSAERVVVK